MIKTNNKAHLIHSFELIYTELAKKRNKFWKIPHKYNYALPEFVDFLIQNRINTVTEIRKYLELSFERLPEQWCRATFKTPVPPLNILRSEKCVNGYFNAKKYEIREVDERSKIVEIVNSDLKKGNMKYLSDDNIKLYISSGFLSMFTIAYLSIYFNWDSDRVKEINEFQKLYHGNDFSFYVNKIKQYMKGN